MIERMVYLSQSSSASIKLKGLPKKAKLYPFIASGVGWKGRLHSAKQIKLFFVTEHADLMKQN